MCRTRVKGCLPSLHNGEKRPAACDAPFDQPGGGGGVSLFGRFALNDIDRVAGMLPQSMPTVRERLVLPPATRHPPTTTPPSSGGAAAPPPSAATR